MSDDKVFSNYEQTRLSMRPPFMGRHEMVVSGHALASQAGMRILERGGNAVDAGRPESFLEDAVGSYEAEYSV